MGIATGRTLNRCGSTQIPMLKRLTAPSTPSPTPGETTQESLIMKILFDMFYVFHCENTHKVWYKHFEIDSVIEI